MTVIRQEEWADSWKEHFKPFRVGERLVIKPTWESFAASDRDIILEIDPGMAFGTGTHATTKLCLEAIEGICRRTGPFAHLAVSSPTACLDVGTGSGILGIGAIKLGIPTVVGIDIDPEAVTVARDNAVQNGVAGAVALSTTPLERIPGTYRRGGCQHPGRGTGQTGIPPRQRTAAGGFLILSGILTEKEPLVVDGLCPLRPGSALAGPRRGVELPRLPPRILMRRFFIDRKDIVNGEVVIAGDLFRHLARVLRMKPGARVVLADGEGGEYSAVITAIAEERLNVRIETCPWPALPALRPRRSPSSRGSPRVSGWN